MMMHWGFNPFGAGGGWWMMGVGMFIQLLFWGAIIFLVFKLLNGARFSNHIGEKGTGGSQSAEEIIKQRFARGEITKEQYKEMINTLKE